MHSYFFGNAGKKLKNTVNTLMSTLKIKVFTFDIVDGIVNIIDYNTNDIVYVYDVNAE